MKSTTYIWMVTILFLPFAVIVFPFYIGWMIADSAIRAIPNSKFIKQESQE